MKGDISASDALLLLTALLLAAELQRRGVSPELLARLSDGKGGAA